MNNQEGGTIKFSLRSRKQSLIRKLRRQQIEGKIDKYIDKELKEIDKELQKINSSKIKVLPFLYSKRTDGKPKPVYTTSIKKSSKKDVTMIDKEDVERKKLFLIEKRKAINELAKQRRLEKKAKEEERKAKIAQTNALKNMMKLLENFGVEEEIVHEKKQKRSREAIDQSHIIEEEHMSDPSSRRSTRPSTREKTELVNKKKEFEQNEKKRRVEFKKEFNSNMDELSDLLSTISFSKRDVERLSPIRESPVRESIQRNRTI